MANADRSSDDFPDDRDASPVQPAYARRYWTGSANLDVAVFPRTINAQGGGTFHTYGVSVKRTYKDGDEYLVSKSFRPEDLPILAAGLLQAHAWIADQQSQRK
jgi:hypothetical protein